MGWASMNRCWLALEKQKGLAPHPDLEFVCPLPLPRVEQAAAPRLMQLWTRHVGYPLRARLRAHTSLVHVLDHSFAELLRWIPASVKKVVTVHDIIPLLEPAGMSEGQVRRFRDRLGWLHHADLVLCVSDFTRRTLVEHLKVEPSKLRVLPNGVDLPASSVPLNPLPPGQIMLLVGSNLERKNLRIVSPVLQCLAAQGIRPAVLRIGTALPPDTKAEICQIIGDERLVEWGAVSDATLSAAYSAADLLFFPSTLEGFGLPVLEAMAHGCPVVCSNTSSLPEVAGDAALYFDPQDAAAAAVQCARIITDDGCRASLQARGRERAAGFTWSRHWAGLCDIYREVLAA